MASGTSWGRFSSQAWKEGMCMEVCMAVGVGSSTTPVWRSKRSGCIPREAGLARCAKVSRYFETYPQSQMRLRPQDASRRPS
jgi:hypothetical protein